MPRVRRTYISKEQSSHRDGPQGNFCTEIEASQNQLAVRRAGFKKKRMYVYMCIVSVYHLARVLQASAIDVDW